MPLAVRTSVLCHDIMPGTSGTRYIIIEKDPSQPHLEASCFLFLLLLSRLCLTRPRDLEKWTLNLRCEIKLISTILVFITGC